MGSNSRLVGSKGRTIRKLIIGGGAGEVKKIFAQGKMILKKSHTRQLTLKNINDINNHATKILTKKNKKIPHNHPPPPPPVIPLNFFNGPSLNYPQFRITSLFLYG